MVENDFSKELALSHSGLTLLKFGIWPGKLNVIENLLNQFCSRNRKKEFGLNSWVFRIESLRPFPYKPEHQEYMRPIVTAWIGLQDKNNYPNRPFGKVFLTEVADGWRVEFWHDQSSSDSEGTENYVQKLFQALIVDGLRPLKLETAVSKQPPNAPQKLTGPQVVALGKKISESFNVDELHTFARKLGTEYENLPGNAKERNAEELVHYADRHGKVSDLLKILHEDRPHINWSIETGD
ncbi:MAG: hypothetical protein H6654_04310 [Ardenticatenaceae bacterium]|nr:hypothetical protein [Anaerolineales bacterium]MCB8941402.1 hypothetical protein [Ardenticatenaceae bacterium]MCB8972758.1 hypothetical protein [Ardenticatenaceae bacterium]